MKISFLSKAVLGGVALSALMAGAAVVMKPSEITPLGLNEIVDAWRNEIGGPDVITVVNGGAETATALIDHSDFVGFTGSDVTGKKVRPVGANERLWRGVRETKVAIKDDEASA